MTKRILAFFAIFSFAWTAVSQDEQFILPMRFAIIGDGVEQLPLELEYDLEGQKVLKIGDTTLSNETFTITMGSLSDLAPQVAPFATEDDRAESLFVLRWPLTLVNQGVIEAIGQSGRILWRQDFGEKDLLAWGNRLGIFRERMTARYRKDEIDEMPFFKSVWAFSNFVRQADSFIHSKERFRICISRSTDDGGQSRVCSGFLFFARKNRKLIIEKAPEPERPARVIAVQRAAALKARRVVRGTGTIQFLAELSNGLIYEFISRPPKLELVELVQANETTAKIVGFGQVPARAHTILNPQHETFLLRYLKWDETIGDFRRYWESSLSLSEPVIYFPGPSGGLFRQAFKITRLPREAARPFLHRETPDSTYVNGPWLHGLKAKATKVASKERRTVSVKGVEDEFEWSFQALKRGDMNRSHVLVGDGDQEFKAYYEMYKGYPREISFRTSAVLGTTSFINGEAAFNYWFEDIYGWTDYWMSRQRWGVSGKYFRTLTPYTIVAPTYLIPTGSVSSTMVNATIDLKYRLTPGLWNRDESWGLILGYNTTTFEFFGVQAIGAGVFWARSMPKLFDDIMNQFWFFRKPKWVDMEFIFYPVALNRDVSMLLGNGAFGNWALNFHGKVLWTKSIFGEAGFGLRSTSFRQDTPQFDNFANRYTLYTNFSLMAFYATVGLGYQF